MFMTGSKAQLAVAFGPGFFRLKVLYSIPTIISNFGTTMGVVKFTDLL